MTLQVTCSELVSLSPTERRWLQLLASAANARTFYMTETVIDEVKSVGAIESEETSCVRSRVNLIMLKSR
jgi:hypothetical protein